MEDYENIYDRYKKALLKFKESGEIRVTGKKLKVRSDNKQLVLDYMSFKEQELEDIYGASDDARTRNAKTLYKNFTSYLFNVLYWFNDKSIKEITDEDLLNIVRKINKKELRSTKGKVLSDATIKDIYARVFNGGFFKWLGKSDIAHDTIKRKVVTKKDVRFFDFETFKKIVNAARTSKHKLAFWLLFDTGIEIVALCQLKKSNFEMRKDKNGIAYYFLRVQKDIAKSRRKERFMNINFSETNELLKEYLSTLQPGDNLFDIQPLGFYRALKRLEEEHKFVVSPNGQSVNIKDFRSSCATYLLRKGWTTDEVKSRLGHAPSSDEIDRYVNYLGLNQERRREKDTELDFKNYKEKYEESISHMRKLEAEQDLLKAQFKTEVDDLKKEVQDLKPYLEAWKEAFKDKQTRKAIMKSSKS